MSTGMRRAVHFSAILFAQYVFCISDYETYIKIRSPDLISYKMERLRNPIKTDSRETCLALCTHDCAAFTYSEDGQCHLLKHSSDGIIHELEPGLTYTMYIPEANRNRAAGGTCSAIKTTRSYIATHMVDPCECLLLFIIIILITNL